MTSIYFQYLFFPAASYSCPRLIAVRSWKTKRELATGTTCIVPIKKKKKNTCHRWSYNHDIIFLIRNLTLQSHGCLYSLVSSCCLSSVSLLPSLSSPISLPAPPHPSPPPAGSRPVAGGAPAKRQALWDAGGLCLLDDRGWTAAADGATEEPHAAGTQSQGEQFCTILSTLLKTY